MNLILSETRTSIIPQDADKHRRYRLGKFEDWLQETGRQWYEPNLATYRDYLLDQGTRHNEPMAPATVSAHLSTIRATYQMLLLDRNSFYRLLPDDIAALGPADQKAWVDEAIARLENAINPKLSPVKVTTRQDIADYEHIRLTRKEAEQLMAKPGTDSLVGLRDTALIALILCTGIREAEASSLEVSDLRQRLGGELSLLVRHGKNDKQRLIPYGELSWCLILVDAWLETAGIAEGPIFRGFYRGNEKTRPGRLSVRAIEYILASYPIVIDGGLKQVKPHDLRRTYARRLYQAGADTVIIQQNLGHADLKTTLGYIGTLNAETRRPPAIYSFDLSKFNHGQRNLNLCEK